MKKFIVILIAIIGFLGISNTATAQTRTKLADGIYLVNYGNKFGIENVKTQQCINLSVTKKSDGLYEVLCGNNYSKTVAKYSIATAVAGGVTALTGGNAWLGGLASAISTQVYEDVCKYYGESR